jgi:hypothetical protein
MFLLVAMTVPVLFAFSNLGMPIYGGESDMRQFRATSAFACDGWTLAYLSVYDCLLPNASSRLGPLFRERIRTRHDELKWLASEGMSHCLKREFSR